jgi:NTP pyrophosphatase (non-canonical NTP hydrolase)
MTGQATIGAWHRAKFAPCPLDWLGLKLAEEAGEVCRVLLGLAGEPIRDGRVHTDLPDELADVAIVLYALADRAGFDLDQAVSDRFAVVSQRAFTGDQPSTGPPP